MSLILLPSSVPWFFIFFNLAHFDLVMNLSSPSRKPLELWLRTTSCLCQDFACSPSPNWRLPQRDVPWPAPVGRGFVGLGGQPALYCWDSNRACHHYYRAGHRGGSFGDGGKDQEEEPWKELGYWVTDANSEPSILSANERRRRTSDRMKTLWD